MLSGRRLDLLDPSPLDVEIEDIAHGLARLARWNGQTTGEHAFSVAQHCVAVEHLTTKLSRTIDRKGRLAALLHDAPEYVIGDLISPFKAAVGLDYQALEKRLLSAIHIRFGLPPQLSVELTTLVKRADTLCAYYEATQLAGFNAAEAKRFFGTPPKGLKALRLHTLPPALAQVEFLDRFRQLSA